MYTLRPPRSDEQELVVDFIFGLQARPESRCLHLDSSREGIRHDLQDLSQAFTEAFRLVFADTELVGLLGCDLDLAAGRGWLHGPFARARDWEQIVGLLFADLWKHLPSEIHRVSNYLELAFTRGLTFHQQSGFVPKGLSHIYRARRQAITAPAGIQPFKPSDAESLCQLHALAFHQSWLSGPEMIARIDSRQAVLIAWEQGQRVGYIRLSRHISLREGQIDFVAVEPGWRGKGIGRRLLQAGLHWIFSLQDLESAYLNVSDSNTNARQLYESAGFSLFQSGLALDWWKDSEQPADSLWPEWKNVFTSGQQAAPERENKS